ncbi:MAG: family 20 glycosylhydrolase, partial [Phycisphaerae bacterium]|nr:family 20 glycosylhydrolase [Phycisphaerae bacterium]
SLGHANWLGLFYPEVAERGAKQDPASQQWSLAPDPHTLNTREPVAWERLRGAYEEVLAWFKPRLFHIGHDEVRWQTHLIPPELRGANDTIDGRAEQFAAWVGHLHGYLAERGVGMMMWTDMLTAGHNGGPPYQIARALPAIPRDTWMVNWSSSLAPLHTYELRSLGFEHVLEGNSEGLNLSGYWLHRNLFGGAERLRGAGLRLRGAAALGERRRRPRGTRMRLRRKPSRRTRRSRSTPDRARSLRFEKGSERRVSAASVVDRGLNLGEAFSGR